MVRLEGVERKKREPGVRKGNREAPTGYTLPIYPRVPKGPSKTSIPKASFMLRNPSKPSRPTSCSSTTKTTERIQKSYLELCLSRFYPPTANPAPKTPPAGVGSVHLVLTSSYEVGVVLTSLALFAVCQSLSLTPIGWSRGNKEDSPHAAKKLV